MLSKASFLFCLLVLLVVRSSEQQQGYYTVVAPASVRTNTPYRVSVSLNDYNQSAFVKISLRAPGQLSISEKMVEVQPGTTELVSLQVPKLEPGTAELNVQGYKPLIANETATVTIQNFDYQVYVQTDKPNYKPGELVQFRVLCIDELLRPAVTEDVLQVLIYDGDRNLVKTMQGIVLTQGVFKGQLQLADHPVLGKWKISVESNGSERTVKSFEVARYVLPTFRVEIATKADVSVQEDEIKIAIIANYAHDEPVKGSLSVNFKDKDSLSCPSISFSREMTIDGYELMSLNIEKDLGINKLYWMGKPGRLCSLDVDVRLTDFITKQVADGRATVAIYGSLYRIKVDVPTVSLTDELVDVKVLVTDLQNNPVQDTKTPVIIVAENPDAAFPVMINQTVYLNESGVGVAHLNLTNKAFSEYCVSAEFREYTIWEGGRQTDEGLHLDILTPRPNVGEELVIKVKSIGPIDYFVYEIVSRGKIFHSQHINVPENATTYLLSINTTHAMVPKIIVYVHRIKGGKLDASTIDVHIGRAFKNSIEIETEKEVRPGASVSVNVTTEEGSYVGLLGIDRRLLSGSESTEDLTEDRIFNKLSKYDAINLNESPDPGAKAGLITITNLFKNVVVVSRFDEDSAPVWGMRGQPRIRRIFSDGWLFDDFERTPRGGLHLRSTIPDAITSWAIIGFSLNPTTGLSLTKDVTTLRVFQSFFVSMDLPTLVRKGEIIEIPVYAFNYNNNDTRATVIIESQSEDLVVLESFSENAAFSFNQTISMSIPAQGKVRLTYHVKPLMAGEFNVTVRAISPLASDAVQKTLIVESEGIRELASTTYLVPFLQDSEQGDDLRVNIPENAVRGSERIELSVVGDTFGPLMETLKSLVQVPYGNGKEMTMHFLSNLLVLKYLKTFNLTNTILERQALLSLQTGYQDLLTLKHIDGSFSFFNRADKLTGDPLETAIVIWALQQAKSFIPDNRKVTERFFNYYLKQEKYGRLRNAYGPDDKALLTSFVLLSLIEEKSNSSQPDDAFSKDMTFLYNILDDLESQASIAICKYALVLGKHERSGEILSQLSSHSGRIHTSQSLLLNKPNTLQGNLEITSENFFNVLRSQAKPTETLLPLVKALLSTGNSEKIPTHLVALSALIAVARDMHFGARDLNIHFTSDHGDSGNLRVNSSNVHVMQTVQLNSATRKVRLLSTGKGFAIVTIKTSYNIPQENSTSSIYQTNVMLSRHVGRFVSLEVCVSAPSAGEAANSTAVKVNLPSGYTLVEKEDDNPSNSDFTPIRTGPKLMSFRRGSVDAILEHIDSVGVCIDLPAMRTFRVLNARTVSVVINDVYNESHKSTTFHELDLPE